MKTIKEYIKEQCKVPDDVLGGWADECGVSISFNRLQKLLADYSIQLIDHILSHPEMIHINVCEWEPDAAVYSYDKFNALKQQIQNGEQI